MKIMFNEDPLFNAERKTNELIVFFYTSGNSMLVKENGKSKSKSMKKKKSQSKVKENGKCYSLQHSGMPEICTFLRFFDKL